MSATRVAEKLVKRIYWMRIHGGVLFCTDVSLDPLSSTSSGQTKLEETFANKEQTLPSSTISV
ncbi:hypothetical protein ACU8KH_03875 [Lachancea thermotolerans]